MLVRGDRVHAETAVRRHVDGQCVVMPHQQRLPDAHVEQFGRQRAVECPERLVFLNRHIRVKTNLGAGRRSPIVVKPHVRPLTGGIAVTLELVPESAVIAGPGLGGLEELHRVELVPALMRPAAARRAAFRRRGIQRPAEEPLDVGLPGVQVDGIGNIRWTRHKTGLPQEFVEIRRVGTAFRTIEGILRGIRPGGRRREVHRRV